MPKKRSALERLVCPYCKEHFQFSSAVVSCNQCGTFHHDVCWASQTHCSVYGCSGKETADQILTRRNDLIIGWSFISGICIPIVIFIVHPSAPQWLSSISTILLGLAFTLTYFYERKSFLFRGLMWFSLNISSPSGKRFMALFYGVLFIGGGVASLISKH